jgi:hypothetical protein
MGDQREMSQQEFTNAAGPPPTRRKRAVWLFVLPLLAWGACCLGLMIFLVAPLFLDRQRAEIPVTGGDPANAPVILTPTATPAGQKPVSGQEYMDQATQRLDTCTSSFHDYYILERLVVDKPAVFADAAWRSDVTTAMQSFRTDCQPLGSLPAAPAAYTEIDHWLKLAAGEVGSSADNLAKAIDQDQVSQIQASIDHLLKFVKYIHNAEGAMDGIKQRKEI